MFGTILENVGYDVITRRLDLDDDTPDREHPRRLSPQPHPNVVASGMGGHPRNIIMLTADAFGVLPPIGRLTPAQAMYHFISGYTAKVAGTEAGVTEPSATFTACFGAPFMVRPPSFYAELLAEKITAHGSVLAGQHRLDRGSLRHRSAHAIDHTRALLNAALDGSLADVDSTTTRLRRSGPGAPRRAVRDAGPRSTWSDPAAYDAKARELAGLFHDNFKQFADDASDEIKEAGPRRF